MENENRFCYKVLLIDSNIINNLILQQFNLTQFTFDQNNNNNKN